eukprot:gene19612-21543_t
MQGNTTEEYTRGDNKKEKKVRERKKHTLTALQKQIEFYFGDANLRHDRFLRRAIQNESDGYIDIKVIADFNKMKHISEDIKLIIKAMKKSNLLQVNDDENKVRRKLPLPDQINTDAQTVYVERLPPYANQDWLREIFSCCGNIDYISLPRYKNTRDIKGFAFIEYSTPKEAEKACQVLNSIQSRLTNTALQKSSQRIESGQKDKSSKRKRRRSSSSISEQDSKDEYKHCNEERLCYRKKRRCFSESSGYHADENECIPTTTHRQNSEEQIITIAGQSSITPDDGSNIQQSGKSEEVPVERKYPNQKEIMENSSLTFDNSDGKKQARNEQLSTDASNKSGYIDRSGVNDVDQRQEKKEKKKRKRNKKAKEEKKLDIPPMCVMTKKEWLRLKEMYKILQRGETKSLKKEIKENSHDVNSSNTLQSQQFHANERCRENISPVDADDFSTKPLSIPVANGTILQIHTLDSTGILTKQNVKRDLAPFASVAYVDIKEGESQGFIRLSSRKDMEAIIKIYDNRDKKLPFTLKRLSETEENEYRRKIEEDRRRKFTNKQSRKERGMDKVKIHRKVNNVLDKSNGAKREHLRFEEDLCSAKCCHCKQPGDDNHVCKRLQVKWEKTKRPKQKKSKESGTQSHCNDLDGIPEDTIEIPEDIQDWVFTATLSQLQPMDLVNTPTMATTDLFMEIHEELQEHDQEHQEQGQQQQLQQTPVFDNDMVDPAQEFLQCSSPLSTHNQNNQLDDSNLFLNDQASGPTTILDEKASFTMITNDDASGSDPTITLDEQNPVSERALVKRRNRLATTITRVLKQGCQKDGTDEVDVLKAVVKQLKLQTTIRFAGDFKPRMSSETRENVWRFWEANSEESTLTTRLAKLRVTDKPKCQKDLEYASTVTIVTIRNRQFYQSIWKVTSSQLLGLTKVL